MNKVEFFKMRDIDGVWHWINPQHVTKIYPFMGNVCVSLACGSHVQCDGDGYQCDHNIQQMIDYLTSANISEVA